MTSMTGLSSMDHGTRVTVSVSGPLASITLFFSLISKNSTKLMYFYCQSIWYDIDMLKLVECLNG